MLSLPKDSLNDSNGTTYSIKYATQSDVSAIVSLINAAFGCESHIFVEGKLRTSEAEVKSIISNEDQAWFLCFHAEEDRNALAACVLYKWKNHSTAYLGMLAISPSLQNRGLGSAIVRFVESLARSHDKSTITLSILSARPRLLTYYTKLGYNPTGTSLEFPRPHFVRPSFKGLTLDQLSKEL